MLQWLPGSASEVMWNDREGDHFVCHILDVKTGAKRTLPSPVYTVSPDGRWGLAPDFRRLNDCRPGYGYAGLPDPNRDKLAPEDAGIWKIDMQTGETKLLIPFSEIAAVPFDGRQVEASYRRFVQRGAVKGGQHGAGCWGSRRHLLLTVVQRDPKSLTSR
jgi:hypothetical protein